jgi:selenocysteine-specific elongation factor
LVAPALAECSSRLDAELHLLADAGLSLKPWSSVHVHLGAAHKLARVIPIATLDGDTLAAGGCARMQLVFDSPVHVVPGDRFLLRNAQGSRTIGGGRVLDPFGPARKRRSNARQAWLDALSRYLDGGSVSDLLSFSSLGMRRSLLSRLTLQPTQALSMPPDTVSIALANGDAVLIAEPVLQTLCEHTLDMLARFHHDYPDETGPQQTRLKRMLDAEIDEAVWKTVLARLLAAEHIRQQGAWLHLPTHTVSLRAEEQALADSLMQALLEGGFDPPWVRELAKRFASSEHEVRDLLRKLARLGLAYQVVHDLFYHPQRIAELAALLVQLTQDDERDASAAKSASVNAARFRDACGLGRKRTVQLMEFFDRVGYTRRWRDEHLLRSRDSWTSQIDVG